jgi:hypothetical protein
MEWLISPSDPYFNVLQEMAKIDKDKLPDADIVVFLNVDYLNWIKFLKSRNREMDKYEDFLSSFNTQKLFLEATQKLCEEKSIELIIFQQRNTVRESALELINLFEDQGIKF